jgi:sugar lactone lactonase YvrE
VRAEPVTGPLTYHGEGPVWDDRTSTLLWVDMLAGDVLSMTRDQPVDRRHVSDVAACVVPRAIGGYVVATERGFAMLDADGTVEDLPSVWDDATVRMNEGACDRRGRFFCGSMAYDESPGRGALYRLDPDHGVHVVLASVTISNGVGWSDDGTTTYYVDTPTRRIDTFTADFDPVGTLVELPQGVGMPDGLAVDSEGGIWVALWGGGAVHRYTADGGLSAVIEIPVRQVSSCAFGGHDLRTLYVTTSAQDLTDPEPAAGALFAVRPGVAGGPTWAFAG